MSSAGSGVDNLGANPYADEEKLDTSVDWSEVNLNPVYGSTVVRKPGSPRGGALHKVLLALAVTIGVAALIGVGWAIGRNTATTETANRKVDGDTAAVVDSANEVADSANGAVDSATVTADGANEVTDSATNVTDAPDDPVSQILTQVEKLKILGCQPTSVKVSVTDVDEDLKDKDVYPQWVATARCLETCSFCERAQEQCLPTPGTVRENAFTVAYTGSDNGTEFRQLTVLEHTSCQCQEQ